MSDMLGLFAVLNSLIRHRKSLRNPLPRAKKFLHCACKFKSDWCYVFPRTCFCVNIGGPSEGGAVGRMEVSEGVCMSFVCRVLKRVRI